MPITMTYRLNPRRNDLSVEYHRNIVVFSTRV